MAVNLTSDPVQEKQRHCAEDVPGCRARLKTLPSADALSGMCYERTRCNSTRADAGAHPGSLETPRFWRQSCPCPLEIYERHINFRSCCGVYTKQADYANMSVYCF